MPTATSPIDPLSRARNFLLLGAAWSLALFALLRLSWVEVTLACSGADAIALCAAASPAWFDLLHVYLWPAALMVGVAAYVFLWMRIADRGRLKPAVSWRSTPARWFVWLTAILALFALAGPVYLASATVLAVAALVARVSAGLLNIAGVHAEVSGNVLTTLRGAFMVTSECIVTPLIPVYAAAVATVAMPWHRRALWLLAAAGLAIGALLLTLVDPLFARRLHAIFGEIPDPQGALFWLPAFQLGLSVALWVALFDARRWVPIVAGCAVVLISNAALFLALQVAWLDWGATLPVTAVRAWALAGPVSVMTVAVRYARPRV